MKIKQERILSLFLALMMLFSVIPAGTVTASAATISLNRPLDKAYTITAREYYSSGSYHGAVDYGCPKGTPVYAAESGTVTVYDGGYGDGYYGCKDGSGWGNYIDIVHGNGYKTRYAHMSAGRFVVKTGAKVERGQLIGYSGHSGNSTGAHLHFGLYLNGNIVYPESYIKTASGYHSGYTSSKPAAPKDVSVSTVNGKLNIKWSAVSGATSYVVYVYSKSNCSEYAFKKETTACSISGIQLNPGRYWICVHAINSAGAGPGSNFVDYLTGPRNLKVTRVGTSIKLSWDSVPNANCYDVIITDPKGTQSWMHTDKAEKTISNCIPGSYKFEVQSLYRNNDSTTGQIVGAHSDVVSYYFGLNAPKNLKVNNNDGNMNISWDKVDGATCYDVIITTPNGKTDYWHSHSTNKTITGYEDGTYKIKVQGLYRENESKTGQIVGTHTDVIIYDYQKANQPVIHTHEWNLDYTIDENPTCTENGSKSIHCKTCNEVKNTKTIPATGHQFGDWIVEKEATEESNGIEFRKCKTCDYTETRNIDYIPIYDEDAPRISMASVDAKAGDEVEVRVKLENNPGITALRLVIDYDDTALEMTDFTFGDALASMNKGTSENYGNHYSFSMYSATSDLNDCGTLAVIKFKVNENAEDGEYPIQIRYDSDDVFNLNGESIHFDTGIGIVTVNSCLLGDVNNDGKINMRDVVLLQQVVNGWNVTYNKDAADYNGDGKINMRDIVALQQYING